MTSSSSASPVDPQNAAGETQEFGVRWRRPNGSTYEGWGCWTENGVRQMVAAYGRHKHHADAVLAVAALVRDVSETRELTEETS